MVVEIRSCDDDDDGLCHIFTPGPSRRWPNFPNWLGVACPGCGAHIDEPRDLIGVGLGKPSRSWRHSHRRRKARAKEGLSAVNLISVKIATLTMSGDGKLISFTFFCCCCKSATTTRKAVITPENVHRKRYEMHSGQDRSSHSRTESNWIKIKTVDDCDANFVMFIVKVKNGTWYGYWRLTAR